MPRGRGGRGRGRGGRGISSMRGAGRFSKPAPPLLRKSARTTSNLSESNLSGFDDQTGVYAICNAVTGLLTIRGLTEEDFERWDPDDEDAEIDSVINEDPISPDNIVGDGDLDDEYLREPPPKAALSQYEELWISPPRRGFYAPPPVRVWRKKQNASSGDGEVDGDVYDEDDPLNGHESMENEDQDQGDEGNADEQITALDIVSPPKRGPKDLRMEDSMEAEAASEQEEEPPEMIEEGELSDGEFPPPFLDRPPTPDEAECDDPADYIVRTRFAPMSDPSQFVKALSRYPVASRDTKVLYELALNTQRALKEWQDEYLKLDARTAPHSNPPKKAVTGSRHPIDPEVYEDMKEADLYGYIFDSKKGPGMQDPFAQRPGGSEAIGGRELRQRRARELGEEPSDDEGTGTEVGKRKRRAVVRYDGDPRAMRGRKRAQDSEPPETDIPPRKRGRPSALDRAAQMHQNIRRLRDESTVASTISESESASPGPPRRRGRPPGSKNLQPRSDAGIKKGPRKGRLAFSADQDAMQTEDDLASSAVNGGQGVAPLAGSVEHPSAEKRLKVKLPREDVVVPSGGTTTPATDATQQGPLNKRKQRVKSEKRSQSMTEWWAARKAKQLEERKKAQAEAEQQRLAAEQQQAERNNLHNRYWTNDANSPLGQKPMRGVGPTIAPAPHPSSLSSPVTSQFIISGPQQMPGHERKRSSPLKHEHTRTLSRDMQEIPPPAMHVYSPQAPPAYAPPPKPIQQPAVNPFSHQLAPITSLPGFRHGPNSSVPPPPQSYAPPTQAPPIVAQGPPVPPMHQPWAQHPYPPPPGYQPPPQQPPYIPSPQSSSHPPPGQLPPFNYPPQHGPPLQPLQPAPPMGQSSPQAATSRGPPEQWQHQMDWSRVPALDTRRQLGPPAPIYDPKQEELRPQDQRPSHTFVHSHPLNRGPEKTEPRDQEQSKA